MNDNDEALMKAIRKRFWEDKLTADDLNYVEVVDNKKVTKQKAINSFSWDVESYGKIFGGGIIGGFLDRKSKIELKRLSWPYPCKLLVVKPNTKLYQPFYDDYYIFNPERKKPDSIIAFKKM